MKAWKAIAAMAENRVIGAGGRIPWHLPDDFRFFKRMTTGNVLVMGRKTFESIGRPLPDRETIILSQSDFQVPGIRTVRNSRELINALANDPRDVFVAGGAEIYAQLLPECSDLFLTLVKQKVEGDTFFPPFEHLFTPVVDLMETAEFKITHWQNQKLLLA